MPHILTEYPLWVCQVWSPALGMQQGISQAPPRETEASVRPGRQGAQGRQGSGGAPGRQVQHVRCGASSSWDPHLDRSESGLCTSNHALATLGCVPEQGICVPSVTWSQGGHVPDPTTHHGPGIGSDVPGPLHPHGFAG